MIVETSYYILNKCKDFAEKRLEGSADLYQRRGEARVEKIKEDIIVGTMSEFALYSYIKDKGYKCSKPDLTIYEQKNKSFDSDLVVKKGRINHFTKKPTDAKIHVKSQTIKSAEAYGASWLFQKQDRLFRGKKDNDLIAFCIVTGKDVEIKAIVEVRDVKELLKEPKVWRYKDTKTALYLDDVLENVKNLWRI